MYNKKWWFFSIFSAFMVVKAQAEVVVILPESGPMARAADNIKAGFLSAHSASGSEEAIRFIDSTQHSIPIIFKKMINKKTKLVVGPLDRAEIQEVVQLRRKVPVLVLNDLNEYTKNIWQFSLSKQEDAQALNRMLRMDNIKTLFIVQQQGKATSFDTFMNAFVSTYAGTIHLVERIPKKMDKQSGALLLGDAAWIANFPKLPKQNIYATPLGVSEKYLPPQNLGFCDVDAIYHLKWSDVISAYQQQPVDMPFQRLIAFGGDTWDLSQQILTRLKTKNMQFMFEGRTGLIKVNDRNIQRQPPCYRFDGKQFQQLQFIVR